MTARAESWTRLPLDDNAEAVLARLLGAEEPVPAGKTGKERVSAHGQAHRSRARGQADCRRNVLTVRRQHQLSQ